jgi:hypothetical protein
VVEFGEASAHVASARVGARTLRARARRGPDQSQWGMKILVVLVLIAGAAYFFTQRKSK